MGASLLASPKDHSKSFGVTSNSCTSPGTSDVPSNEMSLLPTSMGKGPTVTSFPVETSMLRVFLLIVSVSTLMWTSFGEHNRPLLYLCSWDEEIAQKEGTLHVCGERCAQRLQSQFMGNVRENPLKRNGA